MSENLFTWLTPITYWLLVILWTVILVLYIRVMRNWRHTSTAMRVLLWVLVIDAVRTLFESIYFGGWYTARVGLLPQYIYDFLVQPQYVFVPKLINVIAGCIILLLLLRHWLPDLMGELQKQSHEIEQKNRVQEIAHVGDWDWNVDNGELHWSDETYRIFGHQPQEFKTNFETFLQSIHPDDRSRVEAAVMRSLQNVDHPYSIEHRVVRPDGGLRAVQENGQVFRDEEGKALHMIGSVLDVTERKQVEETLRQAKEEAEMANKIKSRFLSNMSHELRTPLNAILGFSEMMGRDRDATAKQQRMLDTINHSGEHLLHMINDVLDLSKIEAGHVEVKPEVFNLRQVLQDVAQMMRVRIESEERKIQLIVEIDEDLAPYVKADMAKLRHILINLLDNAIKFTTEGGVSLLVRTLPMVDGPTMATLQIEIQDSGPGIPEEDQQRIFEPFTQLSTSRHGPKGTGLGLPLIRSFVELMDGEISVESKLGQGTRFRVDLPIALAEPCDVVVVNKVGPEVIGLESGQPEWRIMVVDDDEANRLLLSSLLLEVGFEICEAEDGAQAITLFEQWHPRFIWMDMRMPVLDGYQAIARIRELPGGDQVKIAAITASVFKEQQRLIQEAGCDALVHKPFKSHEIFDTLAQQLGVRYLYADSKDEEGAEEGVERSSVRLSAELLTGLPGEMQQALREAANNLDISATEKVIDRIRHEHPDSADGLQQLMDRFQFGEILALLDKQE